MGKILDGNQISCKIKEELSSIVKLCMIKPSIAIVQIGENEMTSMSIKEKQKMANQLGINFRFFPYEKNTSEREIMNKIVELNNDEYVDGIVVELPLPNEMSAKRIINSIDVSKDVNSLTDKSIARFYNNRKCFIPSIPFGIMEMMRLSDIDVSGKHVVIVGRDNAIGKPLAHLLLKKDATVTVCHNKIDYLKDITLLADILIVAIGEKERIRADMVKEGAIVIDVGRNQDGDQIIGDVKFEEVEKKASYITPVPGGVEPISIMMLLKNVIECYNNKHTSS